MNKPAQPTLEDVARLAKVSTATISRCINQPEKLAQSTREKVEQAIAELGYTTHFGGRALASNRSHTVGAIIPSMENAMFASGLQAFQETLSEAGVILLVASSAYSLQHEFDQVRSLVARGADGLLLIGTSRLHETNEFLGLRNLPCIYTWCFEQDPDRLFAGFDNAKAAHRLTTKVLKCGHRRLAMIAGQSTGNDRASSRITGAKQAVEDFGDGARMIEVSETPYSLEAGAAAFQRLMQAQLTPSAVVCGNDVLAAGAILKAREIGLDVPGDVSVTGFDDINLSQVTTPGITTVRVPHEAMGRSAAELLLRYVETGVQPPSLEFETEIVERESLRQLPA